MKKNTRILALLGVLVVICIATFAVSRYEENVEQIQHSKEVILDLASEDADGISWETEDYSYAFHRDGDHWVWDEDDGFPVNDSKIDKLVDMFGGYEADFVITEVEDYSQYGLDDPVCTVNITIGDDGYTITMGDFSTLDHERYISVNGDDVYLVETDPLDSFELELVEIMQHDSLDYISAANAITFEGIENYGIYYEEDSGKSYCPDDVYFVSGSDEPLDTGNVRSYLRSMSSTSLYDYASYNVSDDELELFGMNDPALVITVNYTGTDEDDNEIEKILTLTIGQDQDEIAGLIEEAQADAEGDADAEITDTDENSENTDIDLEFQDNDTETADNDSGSALTSSEMRALIDYYNIDLSDVSTYIRVNDSQIIYDLGGTSFDSLTAVSYDDLRHADVLSVDFDAVTQIDIDLDDNTYTIFSELENPDDAESGRLYYYYYDGKVKDPEELDEDEDIEDHRKEVDIDDLSGVISKITADSFTDESPSDKEEISLTVYLDDENFPKVTVGLYRYDGDECLAVIDDVPTSLVPRSAVINLEEEIYKIVL